MQETFNATLSRFHLSGDANDALKRIGKRAIPWIDELLDGFYELVSSEREMSSFFASEQILAHARSRQKQHWEMLLGGDFGDDYQRSASIVSKVHYKIKLPPNLYLAAYSHAIGMLQSMLLKRSGMLLTGGARAQLATDMSILVRALMFDATLVVNGYFEARQDEQDRAMKYLTSAIESMAARDFTKQVPGPDESDFPGSFDTVRVALNKSMAGVREVVETIQVSVENVDKSATEISEAAQNLAHRTENQAAALEETAAAMEAILSSQTASVKATSETDKLVRETREHAEISGDVVGKAVEKMQDIETSSDQITEIINVIDEIAFQTNLLALNAGVEAARAGDAGRGFAVVASEVRSLAQRASESALEIKALVNAGSNHVKEGVSLVSEAGSALTSIVTNVGNAADLVANIASSTQDQSVGFSEINVNVNQLDTVTQENAAMVEEASAAIMSLQADMRMVSNLIKTFNVSLSGNPLGESAGAWDNNRSETFKAPAAKAS